MAQRENRTFESWILSTTKVYDYQPNNSFIFTSELKAIDLVLNHIEHDTYWRYIIYTDSLSVMQAPEGEKTDNPLIVSLLEKLSRLCKRADIVFLLAPQTRWYK